jgi:hypothetical protein
MSPTSRKEEPAVRRALLFLACLSGGLAWLPPCQAAPRVEADPNKVYSVGPEAGPWMICATYYTGPDAPELARQLVLWLRSRQNLPAFQFDRGEEERAKQKKEIEEQKRLNPNARVRRFQTVPEELAVLIGGYPDPETANRALKEIKKLPMPELDLGPGKTTTQTYVVGTPTERGGVPGTEVKYYSINPFLTSFTCRNPVTAAQQQASDPCKDPILKDLNNGRPYNLMACPKPYTLAVLELPGECSVAPQSGDSSFLKVLTGGKGGSVLDAKARQAEELARVLREMKFEAYVLHTRHSSVITVGGYDQLDDQQLLQNQKQLKSLQLGMFHFFDQPVPIPVPHL